MQQSWRVWPADRVPAQARWNGRAHLARKGSRRWGFAAGRGFTKAFLLFCMAYSAPVLGRKRDRGCATGAQALYNNQAAREVDRSGAREVFGGAEALWEGMAQNRRCVHGTSAPPTYPHPNLVAPRVPLWREMLRSCFCVQSTLVPRQLSRSGVTLRNSSPSWRSRRQPASNPKVRRRHDAKRIFPATSISTVSSGGAIAQAILCLCLMLCGLGASIRFDPGKGTPVIQNLWRRKKCLQSEVYSLNSRLAVRSPRPLTVRRSHH